MPSTSGTIKITFVNNSGAGFSEDVTVAAGTSLKSVFELKMGSGAKPSSYVIVVNQEPKPGGYVLRDGDRISMSPVGVKGN